MHTLRILIRKGAIVFSYFLSENLTDLSGLSAVTSSPSVIEICNDKYVSNDMLSHIEPDHRPPRTSWGYVFECLGSEFGASRANGLSVSKLTYRMCLMEHLMEVASIPEALDRREAGTPSITSTFGPFRSPQYITLVFGEKAEHSNRTQPVRPSRKEWYSSGTI